jgi:hypothetical protein
MTKLLVVGLILVLAGCSPGKSSDEAASQVGNADATSQPARDDGIYRFDFGKYPADIRPKLLAEVAEGAACNSKWHDGPQTIAACDRLVAIHREFEAKGWCRGPDAAQSADRRWMKCGPEATPQN